MKKRTAIVLVLSFLLSVTAAFSVGYHVREQKQPENDAQAELLMERLRAIHNMLPQKSKSGIFSE